MIKQLNTDQLDRLAEIKEEILVLRREMGWELICACEG